jgi:D-serine deaminase-like pyridoxal phosphate-dependent protein
MNRPELGCPKDELDTPALCLDLDKLESNIRTMAGLCARHGVAWRPHSKAHKSPAIAQLELAAGALGITCAKLGEAEVLADGGVRDLLVANQVVGPQKMRRLAELCRRADPIVAIDHLDQALPMSQAMQAAGVRARVLIEVDIGLHRAGVAPGEPTVRLAEQVSRLPGLDLAGIMGYEGHLLTIEDRQRKTHEIREAMAVLVDTKEQLERAGIPCPIVSAGGTGSFAITIECPGVTELQAGGLIFMDAFYRTRCQVSGFEHALTLVTTVVSRPAPDRAIVDAGRKSHNVEIAPPWVIGREDIRFVRLSAEHGQFELDPSAQDLRVGDRLELVPGYSDLTTVLHDEFYALRHGRLEAVWPLAGRGKIR